MGKTVRCQYRKLQSHCNLTLRRERISHHALTTQSLISRTQNRLLLIITSWTNSRLTALLVHWLSPAFSAQAVKAGAPHPWRFSVQNKNAMKKKRTSNKQNIKTKQKTKQAYGTILWLMVAFSIWSVRLKKTVKKTQNKSWDPCTLFHYVLLCLAALERKDMSYVNTLVSDFGWVNLKPG